MCDVSVFVSTPAAVHLFSSTSIHMRRDDVASASAFFTSLLHTTCLIAISFDYCCYRMMAVAALEDSVAVQ